jgi:hypothetical protein
MVSPTTTLYCKVQGPIRGTYCNSTAIRFWNLDRAFKVRVLIAVYVSLMRTIIYLLQAIDWLLYGSCRGV